MENPQNLVTSEPTQVQEKSPLFKVTPLSKYLAMILFIALPFLGFWIGTIFQSTQEVVVPSPELTQKVPEVQKNEKQITYTSPEGTYRIALDKDVSVVPFLSLERDIRGGGKYKELFPEGTVKVEGVFASSSQPFKVNRVPYSEMNQNNPLKDEHSCCTDIAYWYDATKNVWQAESNAFIAEDHENQNKKSPHPLVKLGACAIAQIYGNNTFYAIPRHVHETWDSFDYYLLTDQGYAINFSLPYALETDYSGYGEGGNRPTNEEILKARNILASVSLESGEQVVATCI